VCASAETYKFLIVKVLIIRFSSIGDIVLTTPVIRCIKKQVPNMEVHYLTKYSFRKILESNPHVDKLHLFDESIEQVITELKNENFDVIIDLHHNLRTMKVKRALHKVKAYSFKKLNVQKWILTNFKFDLLPDIHIVDRYLAAAKPLGVYNDALGLDYFIPDADKVKQSDIPHAHILGYVAIVIGAAHATKRLPTEKLIELCSKINYPIILLGGPEDREIGNAIAKQDDVKIYNSCGKFNLNESADLVRMAKLVVTHDTGLMHIAAAFKKPIVSIWGNTVPKFGMYPYYGVVQQMGSSAASMLDIFEVANLMCRPCSKIGHDACPRGHFKCMNKQPIDMIAQRIKNRLGV
jgi:ADP-heptose:LPS heptosyltransferase